MGVMGWSGRSEGEIAWKREGKSQGRGDARVGNWAAKIGGRGWNMEWRGKGKVRDAGENSMQEILGGGGGGGGGRRWVTGRRRNDGCRVGQGRRKFGKIPGSGEGKEDRW